jgi:hypothetical protein
MKDDLLDLLNPESCLVTPCHILVVNCSNCAFHYDLGFGYDVAQDESSQELLGVNIREASRG